MKANGRKEVAAVLVVLLLLVQLPITVMATSTQEKLNQAEKEKKQTEAELNEKQENIGDLKDEQNSLKGQLHSLNSDLSEVSETLSELETDITNTNANIETTQQELKEAKAVERKQDASMKRRIQFVYERGDAAYMEMLFASESFGDFLNRNEYVTKLAEYDQQKLQEYIAAKELVEAKEAKLQEQKAELESLQAQAEEEKGRITGLVNKTSNSIADYADQISLAEQEALAYEAKIKEQEKNIAQLKAKLAEEQALSRLAANSAKRDISEVSFAGGDRQLLANLIYCEAGGEPYAGQVAVGAVVINRVLSSVFPDTVVGVIYQNRQFSPVASGRLALALASNKATASCYQAADEAMKGYSNVGNCVFFRTPIPGLSGIQIGGHIFY
ncbi:MAG: cell wall hydrolase [Lachnospiraceae bacterium]|nr:cell wall hydrolase [Lachnospiraceae bacterium]